MGRSWRLFATALSFLVFGVAALFVSVLLLPSIAVLSQDREARQRLARTCIRGSFRLFLAFMQLLQIVKFDIDGDAASKLADEGGNLVVANHPTLIDVVVLLAHIDQANCVVKEAVWRNPILAVGARAAGYIPNGDAQELMQACERALLRKETLIMFPEATRSVPGESLRLRRGAANVALRSGARLRLVHFKCEPTILSKSDHWYYMPERQPCFAMRVGGSVRSRDFLREGVNRSVAARRLTSVLQRELSKEICLDEGTRTRAQAATH